MVDISSILFASILIGVCEMANSGYATTTEPVTLAVDTVTRLKKTFLPTLTTFWLQADFVTRPFGRALDQELRRAGFAIVSKPPGVEISYVVVHFGENEEQIKVVVGDDYEMSRLYAKADDGELEAEGGFTVLAGGNYDMSRIYAEANDSISESDDGITKGSEAMPAPKPAIVKAWTQSLQAQPETADFPVMAKVVPKEAGPEKTDLPASVKPVAAVVTPAPETDAPRDRPTFDPAKYNIIEPDADNVVLLNPNLFIVPVQTTNNPFLQLYQPPYKPKDEKIVVSAAIPGPNTTCIINGMMFTEGDKFEGALAVYRVDADEIYLQLGTFLLKCPVSDRELTLRLP